MKKTRFVLGIFVLGLILSMSAAYADTLFTTPVSVPTANFIQCTVVNTSKSPVTVKISVIDSVKGVIAGPLSVTLQPHQLYGALTQFAFGALYSCKFTTETGSQISGGLTAAVNATPYLVVEAH